jgi:hypothetical protein
MYLAISFGGKRSAIYPEKIPHFRPKGKFKAGGRTPGSRQSIEV